MLLPANRPANVLLVDDDEDVLESYCHLLRLSGYHPRATTSPHEALALLASTPLPRARMTLGRVLLFVVLFWWCGAGPMMSGLYLRRPEEARAAATA